MKRGPPLPPITGRIVHRVQLAASKKTSKKRPRSLETQWPDDDDDKPKNSDADTIVPWAGWVLEPDHNNSDDDDCRCYLLSVPQRLWCTVDIACTVSVDRYAKLPLSSGDGLALLEVHAWRVLLPGAGVNDHPQQHTRPGGGNGKPQDDDVDVWSLRALARAEAVDRLLPLPRSSNQHYYSFSGRVHTISPVLTMDPKDPFCLLEVRDNHDDDSLEIMSRSTAVLCSCVVVLRGEALWSAQRLLQPGDTVRFRRVRKQKWRIPEVLQKRQQPPKRQPPQESAPTAASSNNNQTAEAAVVPAQVFVVDQPDRMEIVASTTYTTTTTSTIGRRQRQFSVSSRSPPLRWKDAL